MIQHYWCLACAIFLAGIDKCDVSVLTNSPCSGESKIEKILYIWGEREVREREREYYLVRSVRSELWILKEISFVYGEVNNSPWNNKENV